MIQQKKGYYSSFSSQYTTPLMKLFNQLRESCYDDIVSKACNGDYDHDYGLNESKQSKSQIMNGIMRNIQN